MVTGTEHVREPAGIDINKEQDRSARGHCCLRVITCVHSQLGACVCNTVHSLSRSGAGLIFHILPYIALLFKALAVLTLFCHLKKPDCLPL
jgi:hypothetical protein